MPETIKMLPDRKRELTSLVMNDWKSLAEVLNAHLSLEDRQNVCYKICDLIRHEVEFAQLKK